MENTSDSFMPRPLLFCLKSGRSVCYSVPDNMNGKKSTPKRIEKAYRIAEEGVYMRDYIQDDTGKLKGLSFDLVREEE